MSYRSKKQSSLEASIDQARNTKDWALASSQTKKLAKQLNISKMPLEDIVNAEATLEKDPKLSKSTLISVVEREPDNEEARALLGKIEIAAERYAEAIVHLEKIHIKDLSIYTTYQIRLLYEGIMNRALCLEKLNKPEEAIQSYQILAGIEQPILDLETRQIIETACYRLADLYLKKEDVPSCVAVLRKSSTVGTLAPSAIQLAINKQLGRVLLRKVTSEQYKALVPKKTDSRLPKDEVEEALLLLLLVEDANPTIKNEDITLIDDLCLLYSRRWGYAGLVEVFERVVSTRFDDKHFWFQLALSLITTENYKRALFVLKQCITNDHSNSLLYLMAAKLCINNLNETQQAVHFAQQCIKLGGPSIVKGYHCLGVAYSKLSTQLRSHEERKDAQRKAIEYLLKAHDLDSNDFLIVFHLALQYAEIRDVTKALQYVKTSLVLNASHADSWNLLSLILSSQKHYADALMTCKTGLQECPDISLLITKAKLEQTLGNTNQALFTFKDAFALWKKIDKKKAENQEAFDDSKSIESSVKDFETDSIDRKSVIYTHTMSVYSDGLDNENKATAEIAAVGRIDLWLSAAELFTELGQYKDAYTCVKEAKNISNLSPDVFFQEGQIKEAQQKFEEAMSFYDKALAINSMHKQSLIHVAVLRHTQGSHLLAEKALVNVVRNDPTCHEAWFHLGRVLNSKEDYSKASECFLTAIELEETAPLIPYSKIKKQLVW